MHPITKTWLMRTGQRDSQMIGKTMRTVSIFKQPMPEMWLPWTTLTATHTGSPMSVRQRNAVLVTTIDFSCYCGNPVALADPPFPQSVLHVHLLDIVHWQHTSATSWLRMEPHGKRPSKLATWRHPTLPNLLSLEVKLSLTSLTTFLDGLGTSRLAIKSAMCDMHTMLAERHWQSCSSLFSVSGWVFQIARRRARKTKTKVQVATAKM